MKLSPFAQIKLAAVLASACVLLGCEATATKAGEQVPPVYPATSGATQPNLVTVTNLAAEVPPPSTNAPVVISDRLQEVVKLAQSGVGDDVILAYIQNVPVPFNPTAEEILYLTDMGLSDVVITGLVNHRGTQVQVAQQPAPAPSAPAAPADQPAPEAAAATYNPEPQVVYSSPPVVQYVQPAVEYSYFYSSLAPYGTWMEVADYGWCWQPSVVYVDSGWRPYCHRGRWIDSDCGWYWQSDYSWGWAPFHYGRWFHHPARGWCWRPGSAWSPAWVSWRYTDAHCGWAPLPPGSHYQYGVGFSYYGAHVGTGFGFGLRNDCWTFVPSRRFHERDVWRHQVPPRDRQVVFHRSKVINNYTYNDNRIINHGPPADRIPALARSEVKKVAIRDLPEGTPRGALRPDRVQQQGAEAVVYRPTMPAATQQRLHTLDTAGVRTVASRPVALGMANGGASSAGRPDPVSTVPPRSEPGGPVPPPNEPGRPRGGRPSVGRTVEPAPSAVSEPKPIQSSVSPTAELLSRSRPASQAGIATTPSTTIESRPGSVSSTVRPATPLGPRTGPAQTPAAGAGVVRSYSPTYPGIRSAPQPAADPTPAVRQEVATPAIGAPHPVAPARQTYRSPSVATAPSWNQPRSSAPQAVAAPTPAVRQEMPAPVTSVAPERSMGPAPRQSYQGPRVDPTPAYRSPAPAQSFSLPTQARPAPSYTPPAIQSRPAPSYAAPAYTPPVQSRPAPSFAPAPAPAQTRPAPAAPSFSAPVQRAAPQAAPNPTSTTRSGNRNQQ